MIRLGSDIAPLLLLLLSLAACADEEESRFVTRDSASIRIAESYAPSWAEEEGWVVDPTPVIDLAETGEGPYHQFFRVTDATRLSNGAFVVADDGADEVRIFSRTGAHLRTFGGPGDGPGEFRRLDQVIRLPADSILAYDYWQARITVFRRDGEVDRIVNIEDAYRPRPLFRLKSGGFVGKSTDFTGFGDEFGLHRNVSPIVRIESNGVVTDTITSIPGYESVVFTRGDAWALWGKDSHLAAHGDEMYLGSADSMEYEVWSSDGRLDRRVRVPGYDLSLSRAEKQAEYNAFMPNPSEAGPTTREIMSQQPDRSHRPAYSALVVDVEGSVWLKGYQGRHEALEDTRWQVFDSRGEWLGSVTLPPRFKVFRIGSDWVLGRRLDSLDVQHVQLLHLSRDWSRPEEGM